MAKKKRNGKRKGGLGISSKRKVIHPEAECVLKTIQSHPAVDSVMGLPRSTGKGAFEISFNMMVSMPSRAKVKAESEMGVKVLEPVIMLFPSAYPFQAPRILLRPDFNKRLPYQSDGQIR